MILPTASNGDCFYHSILAFFIGKKVARDDPLVTQFRNRLMDLALENRNKIVTDGESDSGCKPTIVTFYHEPYEECCELNETHPEKTVHPKFLPVETSTSKGKVKVHNFEEWNTVHRERYSWADADITTIIACITGFTIYVYTGKKDRFFQIYVIPPTASIWVEDSTRRSKHSVETLSLSL